MRLLIPFLFFSFVSSLYLRIGHRDHLTFDDDGLTFQKNETLTDDYVLTLPRGENETFTDDYTEKSLQKEARHKNCKSISVYFYNRHKVIEKNEYDITISIEP